MPYRIAILACVFAGAMSHCGHADVSDKHLVWWVNQRATQLEARFSQRPFASIRWAHDFNSAYTQASLHQRPLFVFSFDGIDLASGRC